MKVYSAFLFILISISSFAQSTADLLKEVEQASHDSTRIELYQRITQDYLAKNNDSSIYYANKGLEVSIRSDHFMGKLVMWNTIGTSYFRRAKYDSAKSYYIKVNTLSQEIGQYVVAGKALNNIGLIHFYQSEYDSALIVFFQSRKIREENNDIESLGSTYNNIGLVYNKMREYENALNYFIKGADNKVKYSMKRSLINSYNNIGIVYKKIKKYDSAAYYYNLSLTSAIELNDHRKQANAHNNLALLYQKIEDKNQLVENHFLKSIELKKAIEDKIGLFNSYHNYAVFLSAEKRFQEALNLLDKADLLDKKIGKNLFSYHNLQSRVYVLESLGRYKEALDVQSEAIAMRYTELNEDKNAAIAELETKYKTEKKEAEIVRLSLENEVKDSNLEKSRIIQIATVIGLISLITFLIIYYKQKTKKQKAEKEAQALQLEALQKRFIELHSSPSELAVSLEYNELNCKLYTPLTEREFDSLKLSIEGKTNVEIGELLFISVSTVKFHLRNTYGKMGVKNRKEAFQQVLKSS